MTISVMVALASGVLVGLLLGSVGGGGSLLAIPLLVYAVGVPVQEATTMSLVVVGYTAAFGAWQASRQGQVHALAATWFSLTGMGGAWVGAHGHLFVQPNQILLLFGAFLLMVGLWSLLRSRKPSDRELQEGCDKRFTTGCTLKALSIGGGIGLLTGFFGISGGIVMVPTLSLFLGFPIRKAIGTSLCVMAFTSAGGIVGHLTLTHIDWGLTSVVILGSLLGMMMSTRIVTQVPEARLRRALALFVIATGLFLLIDNAVEFIRTP